jgi:uncharacterized glyoxalase superfamily protein PhnB
MQVTKGARHGHRQAKDHALFVVRHRSGGGGEFLLLDFQGLTHQPDQPLRQRGLREARQTARLGYGGRVRARRTEIRRAKRRPQFKFSEAISFQIHCETQKEVDYFWDKLSSGGEEGPCGWLKDKFGLSWQVVPTTLIDMVTDRDPAKVQRVTRAFLQMKKFDISALRRAYEGQNP